MDVKISFTVNGKARTVVTAVANAVFQATGKSVQALTGKAGGVNLSRV